MDLKDIPRIKSTTKAQFLQDYVGPQQPVVIEKGITDWPAYNRWSLDYMKEVAGDKIVPLYDDRPVHHKDGFNEPHARMKLRDYVELLQDKPTRYRIFLWNILKQVPQLQQDFSYPDLGLKFLKKLPMLFFGGRDSFTFMHYDIDLANIIHIHFEGEKECILFDQKSTKYLYKVPYSLITHESINFSNPDLNKWPALRLVKGFKTTLKHGEMLYIPEGYWHYMKYISPGFSMSLRAIPKNPRHLLKALYNIAIMRHADVAMRKIKGQKWIDWKNQRAIERTHRKVASGS